MPPASAPWLPYTRVQSCCWASANSEKPFSLDTTTSLGPTPATSPLLPHMLPIEPQGLQLTEPPFPLGSSTTTVHAFMLNIKLLVLESMFTGLYLFNSPTQFEVTELHSCQEQCLCLGPRPLSHALHTALRKHVFTCTRQDRKKTETWQMLHYHLLTDPLGKRLCSAWLYSPS